MLEYAPLKAVYIFFDTATYDEIEKDEKVLFSSHLINAIVHIFEGDNGSPIGFDRRHHGPSHWLLHSQWGRDCLLSSQVSSTFFDNFSITTFDFLRFFMSLRIRRTDVVSAIRKRFENHLTRKD